MTQLCCCLCAALSHLASPGPSAPAFLGSWESISQWWSIKHLHMLGILEDLQPDSRWTLEDTWRCLLNTRADAGDGFLVSCLIHRFKALTQTDITN